MKIVLVKLIILLALLLTVGGLSLVGEALGILGQVFHYGIITIFSIIPMLPTSIYDVLEQVIKEEWTLTSITWIDISLVNLASIIPPAMFFTLAYAGFNIDERLSAFFIIPNVPFYIAIVQLNIILEYSSVNSSFITSYNYF